MPVVCRVVLSACLSIALIAPAHASAVRIGVSDLTSTEDPKPQYVIISFDGAHDIAQWKRSRALAEKTGARFTYFLSCVFLLSRDMRKEYKPPRQAVGGSNVGFAQTRQEVADRLDQIRGAAAEGHEIASHACGHFDGGKWTKAQWLDEFASFKRIMRDAYTINGIEGEPADWRGFAESAISGFRAPYLSASAALYEALDEAGFRYDASAISRGPVEPHKENGTERFALPQIPEGPKARRVIAMDYNLFVRHSGGLDRPDEAAAFQARTYDAFTAAFEREYSGSRAPLQLGFHFTLMNDGAYWNALEQFAQEVCAKADVVCTSYADYLKRTQAADAPATGG
ncbi:MAG: polysaccharide deacetylase family protein [Mesorhizobium sp.]|nr:polysaccharide deacetylase [Mesorhizobium sp.]MBL8577369.1 polysaccharide deacetylase family protein [Mesorhizobium sp.]